MILHLAFATDWTDAQKAGEYLMSTRGRTLAEEGFIHCSRDLEQVHGVAEAFYADVLDELLLLRVDASGLDVRVEGGFPHIYGPLPVTAVVEAAPYVLKAP